MQIANPIYDTVFKFLMEDTPSAILLLSTIIDEPIVSLEFLPQENVGQIEQRSLTVYRLDFAAKIKTESGHKQVLIEIQKAKLPSDIMRFRRYLGEQYSKKSNHYKVAGKGKRTAQYKPLPIVSIYFLGYSLEHVKVPVIKVNRHYYDVVAGRQIELKEDFIESLTHDSYVIQISELRETHQTEVEQLLAIFDQHKHLESDEHILDIDETDYPDKYHALIRRLQQATAEPEVRRNMDTEDEILADLQALERTIEEKEQALEKKDLVIEEKELVIEEKDQALEKKDLELEEKDRLIAQLKQQLGD